MKRVLLLLICTVGLGACSSEDVATEAPRPEPRIAEADLTIGVAEGKEPYMFGQVSGIALDEQGRIYVVDRQAHEIRVFDPEGTFLFAIGEQGEGPGELDQPCCPAFGPKGHLWVRDDQNRRFNRYRLDGQEATPEGQIRMTHSYFGLMAATTFDTEGRLISVGGKQSESSSRTIRRHRTLENKTAREQLIPEAPDERVPVYEVENEGMRLFFPQPHGPSTEHAHGPGGDWAFAITDRYEVVRFNGAGDTLHAIERSVQGPPLSDEETEQAEERLQQFAEQAGSSVGEIPFGVPGRKPPIDDLFFDANGRLWVQRSVADTSDMEEADVYDPSGELVDVVQWPKNTDLSLGAIRDSVAYGIRSGGETPPQVVRLRY